MKRLILLSTALVATATAASAGKIAEPAAAPTSLADYLAAAGRANLDIAEQAALVGEADARTDVERAARWPSLALTAGYQHNQYESAATFPTEGGGTAQVIIVPHDQLDATVTLSVPLVDVATWKRIEAARVSAVAVRATAAARAVEVERAVVLAYYQWVGATALAEAAAVNRQTAEDALPVVQGRVRAGTASELDVARATAEVAAAAQTVADARLALAGARRQLRTLTGLEAPAAAPALPAETTAEAPLADWLTGVAGLAEVRAAEASHRAGQVAAEAADLAWLPTVGAFASERLTNAAGFGSRDSWAAGVDVTWRLDLGTVRSARLADAIVQTGAVRASRAAQDARDRITDTWDVVDARCAQVVAAAAQASAADQALAVARGRVTAGLATPLDLLTAQRDAFAAQVARIGAGADLAAARALLRLAAGRELAP